MSKISIQTRGSNLDSAFSVLPAIVIDKGRKSVSFTFAWLKWAFELVFEADKAKNKS